MSIDIYVYMDIYIYIWIYGYILRPVELRDEDNNKMAWMK